MSRTVSQPNNISSMSLVSEGYTFALSSDLLTQVIKVEKVTDIPFAPEYVLGTSIINDEIYNLILPARLPSSTQLQQDELPKRSGLALNAKERFGLLINHPSYHKLVLVGESASILAQTSTLTWSKLELPQDLLTKLDQNEESILLMQS